MNPHFSGALNALKRAAEFHIVAGEHMSRAAAELVAANDAMKDANGALAEGVREALNANAEHNDLRETVERLETIVLSLTDDIKALRGEIADLKGGR